MWTEKCYRMACSADRFSRIVSFDSNSYLKICWPNRQPDGDKYHWLLCEAHVDSECLCRYMANVIMNPNWVSASEEETEEKDNAEAMDKWLSQFPVGTV